MRTHLQEGQPAPDFELEDGDLHKHQLKDHRGQRVLVYFYGRDDTPG